MYACQLRMQIDTSYIGRVTIHYYKLLCFYHLGVMVSGIIVFLSMKYWDNISKIENRKLVVVNKTYCQCTNIIEKSVSFTEKSISRPHIFREKWYWKIEDF